MSANITICSSLEKVFMHSPVPENISSISVLNNERANFQIVIKSEKDEKIKLRCELDLPYSVYIVNEIYAGKAVDEDRRSPEYLNNGESGYYPDLLTDAGKEIKLKKDENTVIWVEFEGKISGKHIFRVEIGDNAEFLQINVADKKIQPQTLIHTDWFHTDCLSTYYGVDVFSDRYWKIVENYMRNAVRHGVNMILTPIFTPPLDTKVGSERPTVQLVDVSLTDGRYSFGFDKLKKWVDLALKCGIGYFEISHLFTQWGAKSAPKIMAQTQDGYRRIFGWETDASGEEYREFIRQFAQSFKEFTDTNGITDICYIHTSDEPNTENADSYRSASEIVQENFSDYDQIDALSHFEFYSNGLVKTPVPEENNIDEFFGKVPKLWTYYCCGHYPNNLPNRLFAQPSIRNRMLGTLLYKYNCVGFLHWGYNFYYSQYSVSQINPFEVSDAGGAFPAGDAFVVYPGEDGKPLSSLRQKVFYDGFQDYSALKTFEELTSRETVLEFIKNNLGDIDFHNYSNDIRVFEKYRKNLINTINSLS